MTPLDLTRHAPRPPHAEFDGLIFLPRSIDKVRAMLPGGAPGAYVVEGLTQMMLDQLGVPLESFVAAVADADDDAGVARFLRQAADAAEYPAWNALVTSREPRGGNRAEAIATYPWLAARPDLVLVLDVLAEDDRLLFPVPS